MTIEAPSLDFSIILEDMGQAVIIRTITRTVSSDGAVTATSTSDTSAIAQVQEVGYKEKLFLQLGLVDIGDLMFFFSPDTNITIYDQIVWNSIIYKIRKVLMPPRINSTLLYKQVLTVRDSS
jgi:hypothetical protein